MAPLDSLTCAGVIFGFAGECYSAADHTQAEADPLSPLAALKPVLVAEGTQLSVYEQHSGS